MNIPVLFVLTIWLIIGLLTLLLNELITLSAPATIAHSIPISCIPLGSTYSICYTCLSRKNLYLLPFHSIEIESNHRFSFVKFKNKTGLYCDQLAQIIDFTKFWEEETIQFNHLEPIFKILSENNGAGSRISTQTININSGQYQIIIYQKIADVQLDNINIQTRMLSPYIYRQFLLTFKVLSFVTILLMMILEVVKYKCNIPTQLSFLLGMLILLVYFICFIKNTDFNLKTMAYSWIVYLFIFTLLIEEINNKYMLILILLLPLFDHYNAKIYSFTIYAVLLFYYICSVNGKKLSLRYLISASAFAIFFINRAFINFYLQQWKFLINIVFQSLIIVLTPLILSMTSFLHFPKVNKVKHEEIDGLREQESINLNL